MHLSSIRCDEGEARIRRRIHSGFTLVELLVVIAVIAILAGLLLPALSSAKAQAQKAKCINNQRQLFLSWMLYSGDHNDGLVENGHHEEGFPGQQWVYGKEHPNLPAFTNDLSLIDPRFAAFAPYLRTPEIYRCPADPMDLYVLGGASLLGHRPPPRNRSYAMNGYMGTSLSISLVSDYISSEYIQFKKISDLTTLSPAEAFVFQDVNPASICFPAFIVRMPGNRIDGFFHYPSTQHRRAGVLTFADGHIQSHRWKDPRTFQKVNRISILHHQIESPDSPDLRWIQSHTSVLR